jgi:hypothetical protein
MAAGLRSVGKLLKQLLFVSLSCLIVFAIANVFAAWYLAGAKGSSVSPEQQRGERTEQFMAKYGSEFLKLAFPGKDETEIRGILNSIPHMQNQYEPFAEFREPEFHTPYTNVEKAGFRSIGHGQGPWPPDWRALNIFVFGGSTVIGAYSRDNESIPAYLQDALRGRTGVTNINVYNFATDAYYSSQEITFFQNQLRYGNFPDIVVFADGPNEFALWNGETAISDFYRHASEVLFSLQQQLGSDKGFVWHGAELLRSLPLLKLAKQLKEERAQPTHTSMRQLPGAPMLFEANSNAIPGEWVKSGLRAYDDASKNTGVAAVLRAASPAPESVRWIETGPRRDASLPWNADLNTRILWANESNLSSEAIYAREYKDDQNVTDPRRLNEVVSRYLVNKRIAGSTALAFGIEPIFAWIPSPLYKYDLNLHPFHIQDEHRRAKYGYPILAQYVQTHDMGADFTWCADIQEGMKLPIYVDQVHYNTIGSKLVADCIAAAIIRSGALDRARQRKVDSRAAMSR